MNCLPRASAITFRASLRRFALLALAPLIAAGGVAGCQQAHAATEPPAPPLAARAAPAYSPFVVDVHSRVAGALPFHLISFKDVGMSLPDDASRQEAYESLAEALSLELRDLADELDTPMHSSVRHDGAITDPSAHLACEGGHLYVDVWRSSGTDVYGYSLWSGCGEDDRFAYNESVEALPSAPSAMDPLAHEIAASLEGALRRRCFQRAC